MTEAFATSAQAAATSDANCPLRRVQEQFLIDRRARGLSPRSLEFYEEELDSFVAALEAAGVGDVLAITPAAIRQHLVELAQRRNAGGVHCRYRCIRALFNWFGQEYEPVGWRNPIARVRPPKVPRELLKPVPLANIQALLNACDDATPTGIRDQAIFLLLIDSGCRSCELAALDVHDVDLETGVVEVEKGKGAKARTTFIGSLSRGVLRRYLGLRGSVSSLDPLFLTAHGERIRYTTLREIVRRRARAAGVPVPGLHAFRRSFALLSLRGGVDVFSLQRLLGHADLAITRRYLDQESDDLRRAHDLASPVDRNLRLGDRGG